MAGDAVRGLRNGLLELRLRVKPGPGLGSVYERKGLVSGKLSRAHEGIHKGDVPGAVGWTSDMLAGCPLANWLSLYR